MQSLPGLNELVVPTLCRGQALRLWKVDVARCASSPGWTDCLSPDERRRADRLRLRAHRLRFTAVRAALRRLLAEHSGCTPASIRFSYAAAGRPELAWPSNGLRFNVSHGGAVALIALSGRAPVGVDLERVRADVDYAGTGRLVFTSEELRRLEACAAAARPALFYRLWTAKEAVLKLLGAGFSLDPASVAVLGALEGRHPVVLPEAAMAGASIARIHVAELEVAPGYAAALAVGEAGGEA